MLNPKTLLAVSLIAVVTDQISAATQRELPAPDAPTLGMVYYHRNSYHGTIGIDCAHRQLERISTTAECRIQ